MQCDIDILGEPSNLAEIELILATTTTLGKLGFKNFQIRINERRISVSYTHLDVYKRQPLENVDILREKLNQLTTLTDDDLCSKVWIDMQLPIPYITKEFVNELEKLKPFGKGNEKPCFEMCIRDRSYLL